MILYSDGRKGLTSLIKTVVHTTLWTMKTRNNKIKNTMVMGWGGIPLEWMFLLLDIEGKLSTENILGAPGSYCFYVLGCSYGSVASFSSPCSHMSTPAHGKRVTVHSDGLNSKSFPLWLSSEPKLYFSGGRKHTKKKGHRFMLVSFFH